MPYALITGASGGLGLSLAKQFALQKHDLVVVARRQSALESVATDLRRQGVNVEIIAADLSGPHAAAALVATLKARSLDIEWLINNAGIGSNGKFWELDANKEVDQINLNVTALVELTRLLLPAMIERKRGRILNIGSTAGFQPGPFMATYYASKAFVNSFTEALSSELEGTGVTATVSCPGPIATEFAASAGNQKTRLFTGGNKVSHPDEVAKQAFDAMMAGRRSIVHGWKMRTMLTMAKLAPRSFTTAAARKLNLPG
jgi:uncharacterized protein